MDMIYQKVLGYISSKGVKFANSRNGGPCDIVTLTILGVSCLYENICLKVTHMCLGQCFPNFLVFNPLFKLKTYLDRLDKNKPELESKMCS